jgi:hypothetical protein
MHDAWNGAEQWTGNQGATSPNVGSDKNALTVAQINGSAAGNFTPKARSHRQGFPARGIMGADGSRRNT